MRVEEDGVDQYVTFPSFAFRIVRLYEITNTVVKRIKNKNQTKKERQYSTLLPVQYVVLII